MGRSLRSKARHARRVSRERAGGDRSKGRGRASHDSHNRRRRRQHRESRSKSKSRSPRRHRRHDDSKKTSRLSPSRSTTASDPAAASAPAAALAPAPALIDPYFGDVDMRPCSVESPAAATGYWARYITSPVDYGYDPVPRHSAAVHNDHLDEDYRDKYPQDQPYHDHHHPGLHYPHGHHSEPDGYPDGHPPDGLLPPRHHPDRLHHDRYYPDRGHPDSYYYPEESLHTKEPGPRYWAEDQQQYLREHRQVPYGHELPEGPAHYEPEYIAAGGYRGPRHPRGLPEYRHRHGDELAFPPPGEADARVVYYEPRSEGHAVEFPRRPMAPAPRRGATPSPDPARGSPHPQPHEGPASPMHWLNYKMRMPHPDQHPRLTRPQDVLVFQDHNANDRPRALKGWAAAACRRPKQMAPPPPPVDFTEDVNLSDEQEQEMERPKTPLGCVLLRGVSQYERHSMVFQPHPQFAARQQKLEDEDLRVSLERKSDLRNTLDRKRVLGISPVKSCIVATARPSARPLPRAAPRMDLRDEIRKRREVTGRSGHDRQSVETQDTLQFSAEAEAQSQDSSDPDLNNVAAALKDCLDDYEALAGDLDIKDKPGDESHTPALVSLAIPVNFDLFPNRKRAKDFFSNCDEDPRCYQHADLSEYTSSWNPPPVYSDFDFEQSSKLEKLVEAFLTSVRFELESSHQEPSSGEDLDIKPLVKDGFEINSVMSRLRPRKTKSSYETCLKVTRKYKRQIVKGKIRVKKEPEEASELLFADDKAIKQEKVLMEESASDSDEPLIHRLQKCKDKTNMAIKTEPIAD